MTNMKELPRGISGAAHLLYRVPRLTPSFSRLYASRHVSASCNRGGTSSRISSATALLNIELSVEPESVKGVRGGG